MLQLLYSGEASLADVADLVALLVGGHTARMRDEVTSIQIHLPRLIHVHDCTSTCINKHFQLDKKQVAQQQLLPVIFQMTSSTRTCPRRG